MRFDAVAALFDRSRFPALGEQAHPERAAVLAARAEIGRAVVDDDVLADCIALEVEHLALGAPPRAGLQPFFVHPETGVSLAFGYWEPGAAAGAHEHTAWTITAVCRNALDVLTFDRDESYRRGELVSKNRFAATAGATGFIYEPCIHDPRNTSDAWSLSLHAISPRDGEPCGTEGPAPWLPGFADAAYGEEMPPYAHVRALRRTQRLVGYLAEVLAAMTTGAAERPLRLASRLAPSRVRTAVARTRFEGPVEEEAARPFVLERVHPDLALEARLEGDESTLYVATPHGANAELSISALAHDAFTLAAAARSIDVAALPGPFTADERLAIGEALEHSGLFKRAYDA